jgi:hypothetical protein
MDEGEVTLVAGPEEVGVRLDRFLVSSFPETTRSVLRKWIDGAASSLALQSWLRSGPLSWRLTHTL